MLAEHPANQHSLSFLEPVINANYANFGHIPYGQSLVSSIYIASAFRECVVSLMLLSINRLAPSTTTKKTRTCARRATRTH